MLNRCSRLVLAFAVLTAGSGIGRADDTTRKPPNPSRPTTSCWNSWAASTPPRIPCNQTMARGSNIFRRQTSARWPNQAIRRSSRQNPPRPHRSRARQGRNKMNNKQRSVLLALLLAAAVPVFAQQEPSAPPPPPAMSAPATPVQWSNLSRISRNCSRASEINGIRCPPSGSRRSRAAVNVGWRCHPEQKGLARQRFEKWHSLPPEQREQLRQRWQRFQSLPPNHRLPFVRITAGSSSYPRGSASSCASAGITPPRNSVNRCYSAAERCG